MSFNFESECGSPWLMLVSSFTDKDEMKNYPNRSWITGLKMKFEESEQAYKIDSEYSSAFSIRVAARIVTIDRIPSLFNYYITTNEDGQIWLSTLDLIENAVQDEVWKPIKMLYETPKNIIKGFEKEDVNPKHKKFKWSTT